MTTKSARLGLILENDGAWYAVPLGGVTALIALIGFTLPSAMPMALAFIGAVAVAMAAFTWLHVQIVAAVIIAKIVIDCFMWIYYRGENHDYYE